MQDYWLPTPFASFPFTSPPVRHRVPSHSDSALHCSSMRGRTSRKVGCVGINMSRGFDFNRIQVSDLGRKMKASLSLSLHRAFCNLLKKHTNKRTYIVFNNLKFTLKHLKRSYRFRSYDHPQGAYFVPC